ncbi:MAG: hypothetical protein D6758_13630 [Gammaproteobacteria bacterium]|nr:MAG: hypothetical protein D6758_13630 [Gammaproteobacteria bacterium]
MQVDGWLIAVALLATGTGACVGGVTNALAVRLLFWPRRFVGIRPWAGWQGVIPRRSADIAKRCLEASLHHTRGLEQVIRDMDTDVLARHVISVLDDRVEEWVDDVMDAQQAVLWENLPQSVRRRVYDWVRQQLVKRAREIVEDVTIHADDLIDFQEVLLKEFGEHPERMAELFQLAGDNTFRQLVRYGVWLGALFGSLQFALWYWLPSEWIWIVGAALNGWVTNWLALTLVFRPVYPKQILGHTVQGYFMKRQPVIAGIWARYVAEKILTFDKVAHYMVHGRYGERTQALITRHVKPILDEAGVIRWTLQLAVGTNGFVQLKEAVKIKALEVSEEPFRDTHFQQASARRMAERLNQLLASLSPERFQYILIPAFESERLLLIASGALLGALMGGLQAWII